MRIDYTRYLWAKSTVDDRAINQEVLGFLDERLQEAGGRSASINVADIGGGVGSMLLRLLRMRTSKWPHLEYTIIDIKHDLLKEARRVVQAQTINRIRKVSVEDVGKEPCVNSSSGSDSISKHSEQSYSKVEDDLPSLKLTEVRVHFVLQDAVQHLLQSTDKYDLIIAASFMDLTSYSKILPAVRQAVTPRNRLALMYAPFTFDGVTDLRPASCEGNSFDRWVESQFHARMGEMFEEATPDQHIAGRRLLSALREYDMRIRKCGSSSWVVHPEEDGYSQDEAYFLNCILTLIQGSISEGSGLDANIRERITRSDLPCFFNFSCRTSEIRTRELTSVFARDSTGTLAHEDCK